MKHTRKRILGILLALVMVFSLVPAMSLTASATCYYTGTGTCTINYAADNITVNSIVVNFAYRDSGYKLNSNIGTKRTYALVFTTDPDKTVQSTEVPLIASPPWTIFDTDGIIGTEQEITPTVSDQNETSGLISGTYTLSDSAVLAQLQPNTQYYALLCAQVSKSKYYTGDYYPIKISRHTVSPHTSNCAVEILPANALDPGVAAGVTVTVRPVPFEGYELASIAWSADGGATKTDITGTGSFAMPDTNVDVYVECQPPGGGGGGADEWYSGNSAAPRAYRLSMAPTAGGSAYFPLSSGESGVSMNVVPGSLVWVCVTPETGYELESIVCMPGGDITVGPSFLMPESDVTVSVSFRPAA